jgi:hypothetical protein
MSREAMTRSCRITGRGAVSGFEEETSESEKRCPGLKGFIQVLPAKEGTIRV